MITSFHKNSFTPIYPNNLSLPEMFHFVDKSVDKSVNIFVNEFVDKSVDNLPNNL